MYGVLVFFTCHTTSAIIFSVFHHHISYFCVVLQTCRKITWNLPLHYFVQSVYILGKSSVTPSVEEFVSYSALLSVLPLTLLIM